MNRVIDQNYSRRVITNDGRFDNTTVTQQSHYNNKRLDQLLIITDIVTHLQPQPLFVYPFILLLI